MNSEYVPIITHFKNDKEYNLFLREHIHLEVIELYEKTLFEYFINQSPSYYFMPEDQQQVSYTKYYASLLKKSGSFYALGTWIYHPWDKKLYHLIDEDAYYFLRTSRNQGVISISEQKKLRNATVALAGLSVGKNVLLSFLRFGIGKKYKIADSDTVALSNFNRSFYGLSDIGKNKCEVCVNDMHEVDPYVPIICFENGITQDSLHDFVEGASIIVGAFDNFSLNIALRKIAKKRKIPIISGFDVEKGSLLIIERYDKEDIGLEVFLNGYPESVLTKEQTLKEQTDTFINIIGRSYHSKKMLTSVKSVGKRLNSYPQLVIATFLTAALFTLAAEGILLGKSTASLRRFISLHTILASN